MPSIRVAGTSVAVTWSPTDGRSVLLVPPLGLGPDALRLAGQDALFEVVRAAGLRPGVVAPSPETPLDDVWRRGLPAAVHAAGGADLVGVGVGAWLAMLAAAFDGRAVGRVVAVAPPVDLPVFRGARSAARVLAALPATWRVGWNGLGAWSAVGVGGAAPAMSPGARSDLVRSLLAWGGEGASMHTAAQVASWLGGGRPADAGGAVDWMDRLPDGRAPLTVLCGTSDPWCSPSAASRLAARWGGPADVIVVEGLGHLDALLAPDAARDVGRRVVAVLRPAH